MSTTKATRTVTEYRVLSTRVGNVVTDKRYHSPKSVRDRIGRLTSDEPWKFYGSARERQRSGDTCVCCPGNECGCGGITLREETADKRKDLPPIESVRVEVRTVTRTKWLPAEDFADAMIAARTTGGPMADDEKDETTQELEPPTSDTASSGAQGDGDPAPVSEEEKPE